MSFNDVIWCTKYDQALNNLAVTDDNKRKIVEAGALPHYVKLLSPEYDETIHKEALHGLWMMSSQYKHSIVREPGCLDGISIDYLWSPYVIGRPYIFSSCFFFFLLSSSFFSSPNLSGRKLDVYHTLAHDVALLRI